MRRHWWLGICGIVLGVALIAGVAWWRNTRHTFAGILNTPPVAAPDFTLSDSEGQPWTLSSLRGQWVLLAYGYTSCPDVCPATLSALRRVKEQLGPQAEQVRVVFVSLDPERDTAALVQEYVRHFGEDFIGLTGTPEAIATAAEAYGVRYQPVEVDSAVGYLISHTAFVYVIDPAAQWRLTIPFGVKPPEMVDDLHYLMNLEAQ
jgi:protein SCO1